MTNIITMQSKRSQKMIPHLSGTATCLACSHEWVAVAPLSAFELECPECGTMRGVWHYPISMSKDYATWTCAINDCGCQHMTIEVHKDGGYYIACCKCGHLHTIDDVFGGFQ